MRDFMAVFMLVVLLALFAIGATTFIQPDEVIVTAGTTGQVLGATDQEVESEFVAEVNEERQLRGLAPLRFNDDLNEAAVYRAKDMRDNEYYSHSSPDGDTMDDVIDSGVYACENLQLQPSDSIQEALEAWKSSSSHDACLMNKNVSEAAGVVLEYGNYLFDDEMRKTYVFVFVARQN